MLDKILSILSIVGTVSIGLPILLHSVRLSLLSLKALLLLVPGNQGEALIDKLVLSVEKLEVISQKAADLISKLFPGYQKQAELSVVPDQKP